MDAVVRRGSSLAEDMRSQKITYLLSLTLIMLAAGCTQPSGNTATPLPLRPSQSASNSAPTLMLTPAPADTPTPPPTPTSVPTLTTDDARARLLDLLANNGGCHLPCLWGITPGMSTYQEAQTILAPLSGISDLTGFRADGGSIAPLYTEGDMTLITNAGFLSKSEIVSHIAFQTRELKNITVPNGKPGFADIFDSASFGKRVSYYMLPHVLSEQGVPAAVVISTYRSLAAPGGGTIFGGFDIFLLYPDQGLLVHYTTQMQLVGANVRGCPANAHMELELYPSGKGNSFSELLASTQWAGLWPVPDNLYYKPIEKATSMSLEQFYQTFRQTTNECLETPASLWPAPG